MKIWDVKGLRERQVFLGHTDMIFSVAEIVSYASHHMTLDPGDVIITGTPEGVILGMPEPRVWLKPGDEVIVEVQGLGRLVTPLVA